MVQGTGSKNATLWLAGHAPGSMACHVPSRSARRGGVWLSCPVRATALCMPTHPHASQFNAHVLTSTTNSEELRAPLSFFSSSMVRYYDNTSHPLNASTTSTPVPGAPPPTNGGALAALLPGAVRPMLQWVHQRYPGLPIVITDNGMAVPGKYRQGERAGVGCSCLGAHVHAWLGGVWPPNRW